MLGWVGLRIPDTLGVKVAEFVIAAAVPMLFSDDIGGLIRQPFSIEDSFSATMRGDDFEIHKPSTKVGGELRVYFCQRDGNITITGVAHVGKFSPREEVFSLKVDYDGSKLNRKLPVVFLINIEIASKSIFSLGENVELVSRIEGFDPIIRSRILAKSMRGGIDNCSVALGVLEGG
ncbi:hypothetical protein [Rhodovulum sulfidophilum]|uniref:hypothetical protein n=1 Tax=Rhodovulum sulfidophilum TaxID=35806 RepID=UPI0019134351|nr:hypothetical protein [Rhodovulum sulfidophilum]